LLFEGYEVMSVMVKKKQPLSKPITVFLKKICDKMFRLKTEEKIVILAVIAFTIVMSYFSIMRMYALKSSAWDLGIYNQAMYTFVHDGKMFFLTPEALNNPGGSLFGIHFLPIFFIQAPLYFFFSRPENLLVLQSFVVGLGAVPTYLISREYFKSSQWRLLITFGYLLNPAVMGIIVFDFHPEAYIPVFYLFILFFYLKHNWKGVWVSSIFLLFTIEFAPFLIIVFVLFFVLKDFIYPYISKKPFIVDRHLAINLVALLVVSIIWLALAFRIISIFNPFVPLTQGRTENWSHLGASNILQVPIVAISNPGNVLNALTFDGLPKTLYLVVSSISWLLLPLISIEFWFLGSPMLILALLSSNISYYTIGIQYSAFLIGPMTFGGIIIISKIVLNPKLRKTSSKVKNKGKTIMVGFMLLGLLLSNPFLSLNISNSPYAGFGIPLLSDTALAVQNLLPLIPSNASVLTDSNIFPLVSSRINAYTFPFQIDHNNITFFKYIDEIIPKVDYILITADYWQPWPSLTAVILSRTQSFGVIGYQDGVLALKRGYEGNPIIFKSSTMSYNYLNLINQTGSIVSDYSSQSSKVLMRNSDAARNSDFWWGPYMYISIPGEYNVTYWLKTNDIYEGKIMDLDSGVFPIVVSANIRTNNITGSYETLVSKTTPYLPEKTTANMTLYGNMLNPKVYTPITMKVVATCSGFYEFRGRNVTASLSLYLDKIDVIITKPYPFTEPVFVQYNEYNPISFEKTHSDAAVLLGQLVEQNSNLLLQKELFPFVIHPNITIPIEFGNIKPGDVNNQLVHLIRNSDFIMIDRKSNVTIASLVLSYLSNDTNFGVYASLDNIVLFKKNYQSEPLYFEPSANVFIIDEIHVESIKPYRLFEGALS
jgi:uncharacterized membrane protein